MTTAAVRTTIIDTVQQAERRGFSGSPTFLLDGWDPFAQPGAASAVACRVYATPDGPRGIPALADLRRALKEAADPLRSN